MEVAKRIKAARKKAKLTQIEAAKKAGIAVNSLRLYESGKRKPNIETLRKIAWALGVRYFDLLDCEEEMVNGLNTGVLSPEDISEELNMPLEKVRFVLDNYNNADQIPEKDRAFFEHMRKKITTVGGMLSVELAPIRAQSENKFEKEISEKLQLLNETGMEVALERITELTEIPRYKKKG